MSENIKQIREQIDPDLEEKLINICDETRRSFSECLNFFLLVGIDLGYHPGRDLDKFTDEENLALEKEIEAQRQRVKMIKREEVECEIIDSSFFHI